MQENPDIDTLKGLYDDLWKRWEQQFDNVGSVLENGGLGDRVVYSKLPGFWIKDYTLRRFPASVKICNGLIEGMQNYVYRLDSKGRPIHLSYLDDRPRFDQDPAYLQLLAENGLAERHPEDYRQGIYRYNGAEAKFAEFLLPPGIPISYQRVVVENDCQVSLQSISIGGRGQGHFARDLSRNEYLQFIRGANNDEDIVTSLLRNREDRRWDPVPSVRFGSKYSVCVEEYTIDGGRPIVGRRLGELDGERLKYGTYSFEYSSDGHLQRKVLHREGEPDQVFFSAPSKISTQKLMMSLSERIAKATMDVIRSSSVDSPLVSVELVYMVCNFVPAIEIRTSPITFEDPILGDAPHEDYVLLPDDLEPEISDFRNRMLMSGRPGSGKKMLRDAARLISERARAEFDTTEQFFVFAIDLEIEGDDLPNVLKACGVNPEWIKTWKKGRLMHGDLSD
jgi:hypothetical protein